jgi:hypothetical protein
LAGEVGSVSFNVGVAGDRAIRDPNIPVTAVARLRNRRMAGPLNAALLKHDEKNRR